MFDFTKFKFFLGGGGGQGGGGGIKTMFRGSKTDEKVKSLKVISLRKYFC